MRLLIVGGSDAGIGAALRARELDDEVDIAVLLADDFPNFSICGLPFLLSGETPDWRQLAHRSDFAGLRILRGHTATALDLDARQVQVRLADGARSALAYDRLVIATGAVPALPVAAGANLPGVHVLHTMDDSFRVKRQLDDEAPRRAVIVGAGYIGVEMADALARRGLGVVLIGRAPTVLPTLDPELGVKVGRTLRRHGVEVVTGATVAAVEADGKGLAVRSDAGGQWAGDLVVLAAGVAPASGLARHAGLATGEGGAIRVDRSMRTSRAEVFAAGDCAETWHRVLGRAAYLPLGTTSHKQGRVAGENAVGGRREFAGAVGTQVVKVFDWAFARTGLLEPEARRAGFEPLTAAVECWDHKSYYPGARRLWLRVTGDRGSGRLLGAQIAGHWQAQVAKRIDVFAAALFAALTVEEVSDLDLSYTPPLGSPWDAIQMAAQAWEGARRCATP